MPGNSTVASSVAACRRSQPKVGLGQLPRAPLQVLTSFDQTFQLRVFQFSFKDLPSGQSETGSLSSDSAYLNQSDRLREDLSFVQLIFTPSTLVGASRSVPSCHCASALKIHSHGRARTSGWRISVESLFRF